jgi:uncharacterized protein
VPKRAAIFKGAVKQPEQLAAKGCLALISFYRRFISPLKPEVCRFYPSCSQYTYDAVSKYGFCKGLAMGLKRLSHCHPFNPGGFHPVE